MRAGAAAGAVALASLLAGRAGAGLIDCAAVVDRWNGAGKAAPVAEWIEIYEQAHYDSDCEGPVVERIGLEIIGRELGPVRRAYERGGGDDALRAVRDRLDALQEFGSHWRLSFLRGEVSRRLRDVPGALRAYQGALALVDDEELTAVAPTRDEVLLLRDRLDETAVVAAQVLPSGVALPATRSGELISQYSFATRGFTRKKVLVPIQFVYAKDVMTESGRASFRDAYETLSAQGSPAITVIGHTDPVGSAEYNRRLSLDRANAVRSALTALGYPGAITVDGKGEDEPFRFDDPGLYSLEVRHQAHRRVELVLQEG